MNSKKSQGSDTPAPETSSATRCPLSGEALHRTLEVLLEAYNCAADLNMSPCYFAVSLGELLGRGASEAALRWLCGKGHAQHLLETTAPNDVHRTYKATATMAFQPASCLVLSGQGVEFARTTLNVVSVQEDIGENGAPCTGAKALPAPTWDAQARELRVGRILVKKFRQPARAQELILAAFEEEGWPANIDDPLPPKPDVDCRQRVHDTIKRLNQEQKNRLILFSGDGTGSRVLWQWLTH